MSDEIMVNLSHGKQICVVGSAQPEQKNPIYLEHELILLILVVDRETGIILDCDVNMVCDLTRRFVRAMYVGRNLVRDVEEIRTCIHENYLGASARALATATRSARMKYLDCIQKERK